MRVSQIRFLVALIFALAALAAMRILRHASLGTMLTVAFVYLSALMVSIAMLLDYPRLPRRPRPSGLAGELQRKNLLWATRYRAERAFRAQSLRNEGPHYFLELEGGNVLHLSGPYLRNYEPGHGALRHFPCTQFIVRRHAQTGRVIDIVCEGVVIEPEVEAPAYSAEEFARGLVPADGEILHVRFDDLRRHRAAISTRLAG